MLQRLHDAAPTGYFTLKWLTGRLHERSFGVIILLLAVIAIAPGVSTGAGMLLVIAAFQMVAGRAAPIFPRGVAAHPFPARHLASLLQGAVPVLRYLERIVRPRWPIPLGATRRVVGIVVMLLSIVLVLVPIPLSNIVPAVVIAFISLAYIEADGLLLSIALLAAVIVLSVAVAALWETVVGTKWLGGPW